MNFRTELEILKVEPEGAMTIIEGRSADGSMVVIMTRVVEPLRVGDLMALTLSAQPVAATGPSMRERMQARLKESASASAATPRLSVSLSSPAGTAASASGGAPNEASAPGTPNRSAGSAAAPSNAASDATSLLLSSILGTSPRSSVHTERNVDDEMDALFGARRKG